MQHPWLDCNPKASQPMTVCPAAGAPGPCTQGSVCMGDIPSILQLSPSVLGYYRLSSVLGFT